MEETLDVRRTDYKIIVYYALKFITIDITAVHVDKQVTIFTVRQVTLVLEEREE